MDGLDETYFGQIVTAMSAQRLESFRLRGEPDVTMVARYLWNSALAGAFHIDLELLEIALRNSIDRVMVDAYGIGWLTGSSPHLLARQQEAVAEVEAELRKEGLPADQWHGRVIAGVPFGFWTALMGPRYEGGLIRPGRVSRAAHWPRPLLDAFPHAPNIDRRRIAGRFHAIRMLRNRISHHEAVWHGMPQKGGQIQAPKVQDAEVIGTIGWIAPQPMYGAAPLSS